MDHNNSSSHLHRQLDWVTTLIPFGTILVLCLLFLLVPERSGQVLSLHPFLFRRRTGQLLSADRPGSVPLLPLYRIFPLWTDSSG